MMTTVMINDAKPGCHVHNSHDWEWFIDAIYGDAWEWLMAASRECGLLG